ncbi:MAG: 50S ribosomal protein L35, partial [Cutibacterium acnes]
MKQKTHKGTAKRIKVNGKGKLRREQAGKRHLNEKLSSKRRRKLSGSTDV